MIRDDLSERLGRFDGKRQPGQVGSESQARQDRYPGVAVWLFESRRQKGLRRDAEGLVRRCDRRRADEVRAAGSGWRKAVCRRKCENGGRAVRSLRRVVWYEICIRAKSCTTFTRLRRSRLY